MIVVLGDGVPGDASHALARGLRQLGEEVVLGARVTDGPEADDIVAIRCAMSSGHEVAEFLARVEAAAHPVHAVVLVSTGVTAPAPGELAALDADQWEEGVEAPLQRTLACFQGSYRRLRGRGGCLVVLVPTMALVGAAGGAPWAAVAEAQRAMAKSAGRSWGHEGITVNCLAVPASLLAAAPSAEDTATSGGSGGGTGLDRPGLPPPSLERSPTMDTEVAPVVASLAARAWAGVTGATIAVDGGIWMTP
ncbi:MAG TPA: SDR family oxidoreductase [Acidimicrobiales bacterium]|nr:SDR family oxidoreductase [Acidimicrobiales bacterium]